MGSVLQPVTRLVLFDARGASPHCQNFFERFNFNHVCRQPGELRSFLRENLAAPFRVLYQPDISPPAWDDGKIDSGNDLQKHFNAVTQLVIACGKLIYAVDEIDRVSDANWAPPGLAYLINQGRHVQVSLAASSRRPAHIPRELTSQAHEFYIFRNTEPRDLAYLAEYLGTEATEKLRTLPPYVYLRWEETEGVSIGGGADAKLS
jgi:hypothetical protein